MATDRYPNQNVNIPFKENALEAARARLAPGGHVPPVSAPQNGKGSRREVRKGEWIDDRVILMGGRSSQSTDSPPELPEARTLPVFNNTKVYQVVLAKPVMIDGRMCGPGFSYQMVGSVCIPITASIMDATELGDIPTDPNVAPSE
jgi:hypothetical protein